ncbi:MAG: hypothetical protein HQL63_06040 [Magnetococcales bacterium]|nr:hypothetical protein [Magnetococcales bacterium]MBF0321570.1 hypothetical protein [Magnetococcales bacterium]
MINRIVLFVLSILGAGALPYVLTLTMDSYSEYNQANKSLVVVKEHQATIERYRSQAATYKSFMKEVDVFLAEAKSRDTSEGDWISFKIDNVSRVLDANDFRLVIANIMHGNDYYFSPERIEILTDISDEFDKLIKANKSLKVAGTDSKDTPQGAQVIMTIKGEYLVAKKRV